MAGSYPDAPFRRMAYDEDGTIFWTASAISFGTYNTSVMPGVEFTVTQKGWFNNERTLTGAEDVDVGGGAGSNNRNFFMVFPELRDIYGMNYWQTKQNSNDVTNVQDVQWSANTTNGLDGTWTVLYVDQTYPSPPPHTTYSWDHWYRIGIVSSSPFPVTGARGFRFVAPLANGLIANGFWHHIHLYGDKSAGATPDRLLFIDNDTGLEFTEPLDWGDVPRGTTLFHDIKIKNNSATLTANTILLDFEALTGASDTWHTMSDSGGAYGGTVNIASLAPTATYPAADTITIKLVVGDAENLGLQACRLQASTVSWT